MPSMHSRKYQGREEGGRHAVGCAGPAADHPRRGDVAIQSPVSAGADFRAAPLGRSPVLSYLRHKVLEGTRVIFSRLWKNDVKPHEHPLWKLATGLGAHCTTQLDEDVTHLITDTMATEKAQWALQRKKAIVTTRWLEGSAIMWKRAHESMHFVPR